ncbi:ABC transporter substrate-binding protein [Nonomuraea sp. NPDC026600]|uniref:ABC transporter substrate-binding protein n=1 Tax=Nonomuraea sp. NPDC026600 TaxID=3155363 RepID=UPI0033D7FB88
MRKTATLIGAGILMFGAAACGSGGASASGGTSSVLTLAQSVPARPWDLAKASIGPEAYYYQPVYDTLIRLDAQGAPAPNMALSWSYDGPQTTLTLKLRTGLTFTDGTALTAQVVKDNLLHTKGGADTAAAQLSDITGVEAVDDTTVAIKLGHPSPTLLPALGQVSGMIASPKALTDPQTPIGSGPYRLDTSATIAGQQYAYVRNPGYWNARAFPYDTIVIKLLPDPTARTNALLAGQINGTLVSPQRVKTVQDAGMKTVVYSSGDIEGLFIWDRAGKKVPALGNLKVRQALNHAFDRQSIVKTVKMGLGKATTQVFDPDQPAYDASLDERYPYDPAKAKRLLAEAGYPDGFSVTMPDMASLFPQQQAALTQALQNIGVKVTLQNLPTNQIFTTMLSGKYPMSFFKLGAPSDWGTVQLQLKKNATWNPAKYEDPKVDALISRIESATGAPRAALMKQLNAYVVDQAWHAPWDVIRYVFATTKNVTVTPQPGFQYPPIYNFKPAH